MTPVEATSIEETVLQALAAPYHRTFVKEAGGGYSAWVVELPGVFGGGDDIDEANRTLDEAMADWVAFECERGHEIPEPIDPEQYSGRLTFRIPPGLHYQVAQLAAIEGVSLNRLLSDAVAQAVGARASGSGRFVLRETPTRKPQLRRRPEARKQQPA